MKRHQVEIVMTGTARGRVLIDGREIADVRALRFEAGVDQANLLTLTLLVEDVQINAADVDVAQRVDGESS